MGVAIVFIIIVFIVAFCVSANNNTESKDSTTNALIDAGGTTIAILIVLSFILPLILWIVL